MRISLFAVVLLGGQLLGAQDLQSAINTACNGKTAGQVSVPAGVTPVRKTITIPSKCTLQGAGIGKSILQAASPSLTTCSSHPAMLMNLNQASTGNAEIVLRDLTVDGNKAASSEIGICFDRVSNSMLSHIECENTIGGRASCVQWTSSSNALNHDNTVESSYFHDNGLDADHNADGLAIGGVHLHITGNESRGNTDSGIGLQGHGTSDVVINGNVLRNNIGSGIAAGPPSGSAFATAVNDRLVITNNTISGLNGYGIFLNQVQGVTVSHNDIDMAATSCTKFPDAIHLEDVTEGTVSDNVIHHAANNGIWLLSHFAATENIKVTDNMVRAAAASGLRVGAENQTAILRNVTISGNVIRDSGQAGPAHSDSCLTPTNSDGIQIVQAAGAQTMNVIISGNFSGDYQRIPTQRFGLAVLGSPTRLTVIGNRFAGNGSGGIQMPLPADTISANNGSH